MAVVGGGAWGTALADLLARKGDFDTVTLWARWPEGVESVNREHVNHMFLPGAALAPAVAAVGDLTAAVRGAEVVVSAAPSHAVRDVMTRARDKIGRGALVVSVSKGLDPERLSTPSCVLADVLPKDAPIAVHLSAARPPTRRTGWRKMHRDRRIFRQHVRQHAGRGGESLRRCMRVSRPPSSRRRGSTPPPSGCSKCSRPGSSECTLRRTCLGWSSRGRSRTSLPSRPASWKDSAWATTRARP